MNASQVEIVIVDAADELGLTCPSAPGSRLVCPVPPVVGLPLPLSSRGGDEAVHHAVVVQAALFDFELLLWLFLDRQNICLILILTGQVVN